MQIKVLGTGCKNCATLEERTREALTQMDCGDVEVTKVEDMAEIMAYGVMSTPALVIDEKVVVSGRVPEAAEIKDMLASAAPEESNGSGGCGCSCEGCC